MPVAILFEVNQYFRNFYLKNKAVWFNAEINAMPSSQIGVRYPIIWCREAGVLPAECRARLELLPGNGGKVVPDGQILCQRKVTACSDGETGQKLLCRWKDGMSGVSVGIAWVVSNGHSLLI